MFSLAFSKLRFLVLALLVLAVAVAAPRAEAVISCNDVSRAIAPCMGYLGGSKQKSPACCPSIRYLRSRAKTREDRRAACFCLKRLAANYGRHIQRAQRLLNDCNVRLGYPVNLSINCNKVP